jgi:hypothetical protein
MEKSRLPISAHYYLLWVSARRSKCIDISVTSSPSPGARESGPRTESLQAFIPYAPCESTSITPPNANMKGDIAHRVNLP